MQIVAKYDRTTELAEAHEQIVARALEDGVITPSERREIIASATLIKLASHKQAIRCRLGTRMIRGGNLDREIMQDVLDYQELSRQEEKEMAAFADQAKAA